MAFCSNCGKEMSDDSRFCSSCGKMKGMHVNTEQRRTVYEGMIHKCPSCGEILDGFEGKCSACGYEIRGASSSRAINEFSSDLRNTEDVIRKATIIRDFPVPNTKEDLLEFMIMAMSNIDETLPNNVMVAWRAKAEQVYQKACIIITNESELARINSLYNQVLAKIKRRKTKQKLKSMSGAMVELMPVLPNTILVFGWLLSLFILIPLCGINQDTAGTNGSQFLLIVDLIAGAFLIPIAVRCASFLPGLVTVLGVILSICVIIPKCGKNLDSAGSNAYQFILIVDIICSVVIFRRMFKAKKDSKSEYKMNRASLVFALCLIAVLFVTYIVSSLVVSIGNNGEKESDDVLLIEKDYDAIYTWPDDGLSVLIPNPDKENGEIEINSDETFKMATYDVAKKEYENYIESCIEKGFCVDAEKTEKRYSAYNLEGYQLSVSYDDVNKEMSICIEIPVEMGAISWPSSGIAKKLPKPESKMGDISTDSNDTFTVYVGGMSIDDFNEYIDKCLKKGFDFDYSRYDKSFYAENKAGDNLTVKYLGYNTVYISIYNWD